MLSMLGAVVVSDEKMRGGLSGKESAKINKWQGVVLIVQCCYW